MSKQKALNFQVKGESALRAAPALYSNFLAVSRVGTDVQFEFIFLDLNHLAVIMEQLKGMDVTVAPTLQGKTVAKLVMPAAAFLQLRGQFETIFEALQEMLPKASEVSDEHRGSGTG